MKYYKAHVACLAFLCVVTASSAMAIANAGQDNRVEWTVAQSWPIQNKTLDMVHSLDGKFVYILNDKNQVQVFDRQGGLQGNIPVDAGVSGIDISPRGEVLYLIDNVKNTFSSVSVSLVVDIDTVGSPSKGPADAPVTVAVFSDFECPYCGKILPLLEQVLEKNPKTVKIVYKNMPLGIHKAAVPAALAALAAHEQGKFWEFHDKLFAVKKLDMITIKGVASDLNLDMSRFENDMKNPNIKAKLDKDLYDAQQAGVTGTPAIFINGRTPVQNSFQEFQKLIDDELSKIGKKK